MASQPMMNIKGKLNHKVGSLVKGGKFVIIPQSGNACFAEGEMVYCEPLQFKFSGGSVPGMVPGSVFTPAICLIEPDVTKFSVSNKKPIRLGNFGKMMLMGIHIVTGAPIPLQGQAEVIDAGQKKFNTL